jgi:glucose-1-phosphate cytidylyltransferase
VKAVILAGGIGSRISEESHLKPKPMIEIGGKPIIWHIMKIYSAHGIDDFVICLGYKGYVIKEYFANYFLHMSDVTLDMANNRMEVHQASAEPWRVTLVDTGEDTMTGGRLKRVASYLGDEDFCFTYGDGVADVDIRAAVDFHRRHGRKATLTAVQPPGRFGALELDGDRVRSFLEKPEGDGGWINGGFFVLSPAVLAEVDGDRTVWEREPMERLAAAGQLRAYFHRGFWQPMDTLRDRNQLEDLWSTGRAPWKTW